MSGVEVCLGDGDDTVTSLGGPPRRVLSALGGPGSGSIAGGVADARPGGTGWMHIDGGVSSDPGGNVESTANRGSLVNGRSRRSAVYEFAIM
ncbi:hypothetical protein FAIPA1_160037 [Frankia sp. AiPs1]